MNLDYLKNETKEELKRLLEVNKRVGKYYPLEAIKTLNERIKKELECRK